MKEHLREWLERVAPAAPAFFLFTIMAAATAITFVLAAQQRGFEALVVALAAFGVAGASGVQAWLSSRQEERFREDQYRRSQREAAEYQIELQRSQLTALQDVIQLQKELMEWMERVEPQESATDG